MINRLYRLTGALHPTAIGDGFVVPLFESEDHLDQSTYVQSAERDMISGFDPVELDEDDVIISTNSQRHMAIGDRPLRGFRSRSAGLLIGNVFYLANALRELHADYPSGSAVRRSIDAFLAENPNELPKAPINEALGTRRGRTTALAAGGRLRVRERGSATPRKATFVTEPLERGFGLTLGNALRRVLLSSIEGAAITSVRIDGVLHEYSSLAGMHEDVSDLIGNVRQTVFRLSDPNARTLQLDRTGPGLVRAGDITSAPGLEVCNPELVLCTLEPGIRLAMDLFLGVGTGFSPASANRPPDAPLGLIPVDATFSPVRQVSYRIDPTRVGENDYEYDKLTLTVETDGSTSPDDAVAAAARILQSHLDVYAAGAAPARGLAERALPRSATLDPASKDGLAGTPREDATRFLSRRVDHLELSARSAACLGAVDIVYVGDLARLSEADVLRIPNIGRRSLAELKEVLASMGLRLGMDLRGWRPDDAEEGSLQSLLRSS